MPQLFAPWSVHWFSGSCPGGTLVQVPSVPASAHDWQVPVQAARAADALLRSSVMHSPAAAQAAPVGFLVQTPITHTLGAAQSVSTVHEVLHTLAPQV